MYTFFLSFFPSVRLLCCSRLTHMKISSNCYRFEVNISRLIVFTLRRFVTKFIKIQKLNIKRNSVCKANSKGGTDNELEGD